VKVGSQGTWQFVAADIIDDPNTTQTFIHDLESAFYVLFSLALRFMETTWSAVACSYFLNVAMDPPTFESGRDGKTFFSSNAHS
jgi:hypothetical protein